MFRPPIYGGKVLGRDNKEKLNNIEKFLNNQNSPMHSDIRKTLGPRERKELMGDLRRKFEGSSEPLTEFKLRREIELCGYKGGDLYEKPDAKATEQILKGRHLTKEEISAAHDETDEG